MPNKHLVHVNSNETVTDGNVTSAKLPSASDLMHGELAVNYKTGYETISMKNDTNNIVKFVSENVVNTKQDVIDSSHKLSADLVDDTNTTNKFTNATEKQTWNAKQDALTFNTAPSSSNKVATMADIPTTMTASGSGHNGGLVPDTPSTQGTTKFLREDGTWSVPAYPDISGKEDKMAISTQSSNFTATVGNYYKVDIGASVSRTITLTTPSDSTKVSNCIFYVTTSTSPSLTISAASGIAVYYSDGYTIEASSNYEINALWNGTTWYITSVRFESTP